MRVRWRVVNLSTQAHPMHLHGFYFDVERQGDGMRDDGPSQRTGGTRVVTHLMAPRLDDEHDVDSRSAPGNWLFHCHTMVHVSPTPARRRLTAIAGGGSRHDRSHPELGMTGLVLGITVRGPDDAASASRHAALDGPRSARQS